MNINDAYDMPTVDGASGQVLTTNGSGVASWQASGYDAILNTTPGNSQLDGQSASIDLIGSMELSGTAKVFGNVVLANAPNKTTTIGNDGNAFNAIIKVTEYMDVSNISSGNSVWVTFPVSKAALDGAVSISPAGPLADKIVIAQAYVSAVGEVRVNFRNTGGSSYNPSGMNYYISVIQ